MAIYLIRHGETTFNAERIVQFPDTPLSERGETQARLLGERLAGEPIGAILASDYARALATAEAVRATTGAPIEVNVNLRERNLGDHRGLRHDELGQNVHGLDYEPPGGETLPEFHARVSRAWRDVLDYLPGVEGHLAVVTHGLVCRSLVDHHLALDDETITSPTLWGNTALTVVEAEPPWRVTLLNCTAHLDAATINESAGGY